MLLAGAGPDALAAEAARSLNGSLDGALLLRGDQGYAEVQALVESINSAYNDKRKPAVIVRAASVEDVAAGVRLAAQQQAPMCVRAGAHDSVGACLCEGGVLVDVGAMKVCVCGGGSHALGGPLGDTAPARPPADAVSRWPHP